MPTRLQAIAWALLGQQLLQLVIGTDRQDRFDAGASAAYRRRFSPSGWLAVILPFVLARVFAEGALMREDLEGTV